ncbi:MAG TPA: DUF2147 domain-containing protein [Candidatus Sulfotelmatobacter sp.]|nr:DUF2147 domain-containing protein [Candidatus Sulfotelmatobacter sp.]
MMAVLVAGLLAAWCRPAAPAAAADGLSPLGVWATEGEKSHVKIEACGDKLCGSVIWLKEPLDDKGREKTDQHNSDEALRARKIVGLAILSGFVPEKDEPGVWEDGKIYNPEDGKTYSCTLTVKDASTLRVRGYVGIALLGKTQIWKRVE